MNTERADPAQPGPVSTLLGAEWRTRGGSLLTLRHCHGPEELEACVDLQRQTWGYPDIEVTPRKAFLLAQELGGQVIAAFDEQGGMAGFAMSMAALAPASSPNSPPQPYLHSHMLAVLPEYRNQGLGARLKLAQREDALNRGILRMTWTFDPLAAKNAYLNLHRLGAIAYRYSPDFYGVSSSRLQGGLPTDRLHAEWWLQSPRVRACVRAIAGADQQQPSSSNGNEASEDRGAMPVKCTISLPAEIEAWKQDGLCREKLEALQGTNRALFLDAFARGLVVTDFNKDACGDGVFALTQWHPSLSTP